MAVEVPQNKKTCGEKNGGEGVGYAIRRSVDKGVHGVPLIPGPDVFRGPYNTKIFFDAEYVKECFNS